MKKENIPTERTWRLSTWSSRCVGEDRSSQIRHAKIAVPKNGLGASREKMRGAGIGLAEIMELKVETNNCAIINSLHDLQRDSCGPRRADGRQLPVECLETVLVGELAPPL